MNTEVRKSGTENAIGLQFCSFSHHQLLTDCVQYD